MSVNTASVGWNGEVNPAWGLVAKIGPWAQTSADQQKLNSRAGGPHAGHADFFYSIKPKPFIQSSFIPFEYLNTSVVTKEDFEQPRGVKIPGINKSGSRGAGVTGKKIKELDVFNENIFNNPEQGGIERPKEEIISRNLTRPTDVKDDVLDSINDSLNKSPKDLSINTNLLEDDHLSFNRSNGNPRGMPIITNHRGTFRAPLWADSASSKDPTSIGSSMSLDSERFKPATSASSSMPLGGVESPKIGSKRKGSTNFSKYPDKKRLVE